MLLKIILARKSKIQKKRKKKNSHIRNVFHTNFHLTKTLRQPRKRQSSWIKILRHVKIMKNKKK
jgi:hypothetical protein